MTHAAAVAARTRPQAGGQPEAVPAHAHHWETSYFPFTIALGILLASLAFSFFFVYNLPLATVLSLGIGVPLIVIGIVGWVREALGHHGEGLGAPGMGWFILAEALIFLSLFSSYWVVRLGAHHWPPAGTPSLPSTIPLIMTAILVSSSFTIHIAEVRHERGDHSGFVRWLALTILLGVTFFCFTAFEWSEFFHKGFNPGTNIFGTMLFSITGFHAGHVLIGVGIFLAMLIPALAGKTYTNFITSGSMYWHFVDVIWLFVVSQVYFW